MPDAFAQELQEMGEGIRLNGPEELRGMIWSENGGLLLGIHCQLHQAPMLRVDIEEKMIADFHRLRLRYWGQTELQGNVNAIAVGGDGTIRNVQWLLNAIDFE